MECVKEKNEEYENEATPSRTFLLKCSILASIGILYMYKNIR